MTPPAPAFSFSVVIIANRRLDLLQRCVRSVEAAEPPAPREVVLVLNGASPELRDWAAAHARGNTRFLVRELPEPSKAQARNAGVDAAGGEFVHFLDDDVVVSPDLFRRLAEKRERYPDAGVFGGPNLTPPGSPTFQSCAGFVLESPWGAGRMSARYRRVAADRDADDRSLILCNLALRRALLTGPARFDARFFYNEENQLLETLRRDGVRMVYSPDLVVFHARRGDWTGFVRQVWNSGVGRGQMTRLRPSSLRWDFLTAPLFALYLLVAFWRPPWSAAPLAVYAAATALEALRFLLTRKSLPGAMLTTVLIISGHLAYAVGFFAGLARRPPAAAMPT